MDSVDFSFVADALLALCGESQGAPFLLNDHFEIKAKADRRTDWFLEMANVRRPSDVLFQEECRAIVRKAELTNNQAEVLDLRLNGLSFDQIGRRRGKTRQAVMKIFLQAIKKIGRVIRVYPYAGLSDVYRYEVRRGSRNRSFGKMTSKVAMRPSR